jgi:hypothetical protein
MQAHFQYLIFKLFPMVYQKLNLDHIYYTHFCHKYLEAQNDYPLGALGTHFLALFHTSENAWDSFLRILPHLWKCASIWGHSFNLHPFLCPSLGCKLPTAKVATSFLSNHHLFILNGHESCHIRGNRLRTKVWIKYDYTTFTHFSCFIIFILMFHEI